MQDVLDVAKLVSTLFLEKCRIHLNHGGALKTRDDVSLTEYRFHFTLLDCFLQKLSAV